MENSNTEVIKVDNKMNEIILQNFTKNDLDVFFSLCAKVENKADNLVEISFDEIKRLAQVKPKSNKEMNLFLKKLGQKIVQATVIEGSELDFSIFPFFKTFRVKGSQAKPVIEVAVHEDFVKLLNVMLEEGNFTTFDLIDYVQFKSPYTKEIFRWLKQFRGTGFRTIKIEKFREKFAIPKSYTFGKMEREILKKVNEELSEYYNHFEIKKLYAQATGKRGRPPVVALEFYFDKEKLHQQVEFKNNQEYSKPQIDYAGAYVPPKKEAKTGKPVPQKTNVPEWSNQGYENKTTPERKELLTRYKQLVLKNLNEGLSELEDIELEAIKEQLAKKN